MSSEIPLLHELREQALLLVDQLPGPVRRLALAAGDCTLEVEFDLPGAPAAVEGAPAAPHLPSQAPPAEAGEISGTRATATPQVGTFYRPPRRPLRRGRGRGRDRGADTAFLDTAPEPEEAGDER